MAGRGALLLKTVISSRNTEQTMPNDLEVLTRGETLQYDVYTTEFDRVVHMAQIASAELLDLGAAHLEKQREAHACIARVDLSDLIADTTSKMQEAFSTQDVDPDDTSVTFLVDMSGSTRGRVGQAFALAVIEACAALETMGVKTTVLGHTTASWKGGEARKKWLADGRPRDPGRLCELLHVVCKYPDETVASAARYVAGLAEDSIKREQADGEALAWAAALALEVDRENRVVVAVTDSLWPIDDSTLSVNPHDYLALHLKSVADGIEEGGEIALSAVCVCEGWKMRDELKRLEELDGTIYPRQVIMDRSDDFPAALEAIAGGIALGIDRVADLRIERILSR